MRKAKFALLLGIATCVYSVISVASAKTNDSEKNIGLARADKIETNKVDLNTQAAVTPTIALALACPETPAAIGATVVATGYLYHLLVGRQEAEKSGASKTAIKGAKLSSLD
ncbi:MAG TPA: hypothetical protein VM802_18270 [Chitinophaga sp.]|uniref:hypothetical protein n=1 Tax=Chitinophaga sp. TaxID=1869181 RepID=UPI002D04CF3F|nr:hypothetical protein [Chitinophaga sp.]HVI46831.1 hypothetical protein [Chitinophaga sp.]